MGGGWRCRGGYCVVDVRICPRLSDLFRGKNGGRGCFYWGRDGFCEMVFLGLVYPLYIPCISLVYPLYILCISLVRFLEGFCRNFEGG
jgi:hypothetical protein